MFQLPNIYKGLENEVRKEFIFDPQDRWRVPAVVQSPLCRPAPQVESVTIVDDTLREGLNTPGVYPTIEGKFRIAEMLEEAGVTEIEGGYPDVKEHAELIKKVKRSRSRLKVSGFVVTGVGDPRRSIDAAVDAGVDRIRVLGTNISHSISPPADAEAGLGVFRDTIRYAKGRVQFVSAAPLGGASLDMIRRAVTAAVEAGADRVYVNDSQGGFTPEAAAYLVKLYRELVGSDVQVAFHGHDDYGFAAINGVQAVLAGADVVDVTVNRMCHRSGLADLAQVVLALETLYGVQTGVNLERIHDLCKGVEKEFDIAIPPNAPHIGSWAYCHTGIHPQLAGGKWWVFENVKAETIGQRRSMLWTPTVLDRGGMKGAVAHKAAEMGFSLREAQLAAISDELRNVFRENKYATTEEVERIIRKVCA